MHSLPLAEILGSRLRGGKIGSGFRAQGLRAWKTQNLEVHMDPGCPAFLGALSDVFGRYSLTKTTQVRLPGLSWLKPLNPGLGEACRLEVTLRETAVTS